MSDLRIPFEDLVSTLQNILLKFDFTSHRASLCAELFAKASLDGVASHGINRFPVFLEYINKGYVDVAAEPVLRHSSELFERWDGQLGPGNLNAYHGMERAIDLAKLNGIGCVAIGNSNHWMRGGSYGWQAAEKGCIAVCITNTKPNMPVWGGNEPLLGNNPLVIAIPREKGPLVLDMALAQFSYGKMEQHVRDQSLMPYDAGFDDDGNLTKDPAAIIANELALPAGLWKGAGLSLMFDILVSLLSEGKATHEIGELVDEHSVSQVFFCLSPGQLGMEEYPEEKIDAIISQLKASSMFDDSEARYPGEHTLKTRQANLRLGVPVDQEIWKKILDYLDYKE